MHLSRDLEKQIHEHVSHYGYESPEALLRYALELFREQNSLKHSKNRCLKSIPPLSVSVNQDDDFIDTSDITQWHELNHL